MRHALCTRTLLVALCATLASGCGSREASGHGRDAAREFFKGKTMTYVVATEPGGGYDTYGRLLARHIGKYLGLSRVVVKNVPGGGHLRGANEINGARPDGLTLGTFNTGLIYGQLLRADGVTFDLEKLTWIGKAGRETRVLIVSKASGFRSLDDVRAANRPLLVGTSGVGTQGYNDALIIGHVLGLRTKLVHGLAAADAQMSMMRGEIDGEFASLSSYHAFLRNGYGHALFRVGDVAGEAASIPEVQTLGVAEDSEDFLQLITAQARLQRWTAGPPAIPSDRVALLREAYLAALNDADLRAEAARLQIPIDPMDGATLASEIAAILSQSPQMAARVARVVGQAATEP